MNTSHDPQRQVRTLRELPQEVTPARDLWPAIASQLAPRRRAWIVPASLAATGAIVALAFVISHQVRNAATPLTQPPPGGLIRAALMTDPTYQSHRDALLRGVDEKLKHLPPDSQRRVRDSLQSVQSAMKTLESELGRESGNALLQELLISSCQEELRVLTAIDALDGSPEEI